MVFEKLSVKLESNTTDLQAGLGAAREAVESTGDKFSQLARRASRADDTLEEAGDEAAETAGTFALLSASTSGLSVSFGALTSSITTATVAATGLIAVVGTLLPALGALAAIGGSIGLVGIAGGVLAVTQQSGRLKSELSTLKGLLLNEFAPATQAAGNVLSRLITEFVSIVNQLGPTEKEVTTIAGAFEQLGINVINAIPPLVDAATQLTAKFLPGVADASGGLEGLAKNIRDLVTSQKFENFISNITAAAKELAPEFKQIAVNLGAMTDKSTVKGIATIVDAFADMLVFVTAVLAKLDPLFEALSTLSRTFGGFGDSNIADAGVADVVTNPNNSILPDVAPAGSQSPVTRRAPNSSPTGAAQNQEINIAVKGDTGVVEEVAVNAAGQKLQEQADRAQQNAGTGGPSI